MRIAIMSDIHGNLPALEAVLANVAARGPFDALGVAGDLCEWGPQPHEALARVRGLGCPVVQGNTDRNVTLGMTDEARLRALGKTDNSIKGLAWTRAQIGAEGAAYLAALPFAHTYPSPTTVANTGDGRDGQGMRENGDVLMVHANPRDLDTHLDPDAPPEEIAPLLAGVSAEVVAFGHLHTPYIRRAAGRLLVDVSSVGYPRDEDRRAAYGILEWDEGSADTEEGNGDGGRWQATIVRVPYDLEATAAAFRASGMPNAEKRIRQLYRASYKK